MDRKLSNDEVRNHEFDVVRLALATAGLPSEDFGRFTSNQHPGVIRPSMFDFEHAVPVLLAVLPKVSHPDVMESIVRSLSTSHARPRAALPLIALFKSTAADSGLKWAIGNALSIVTTPSHKPDLLALARDARHGRSRQMLVERLGRMSGDPQIIETLRVLATDPDVALHAQAGLRRLMDYDQALALIRPLLTHESEDVRRGASYNMRKAAAALRRRARG